MGMGNRKDPYQEILRKERNAKARANYQKKKSKKAEGDLITSLVMLPVEIALAPVKAVVEVNKEKKKAEQKKKIQAAKRSQAAKNAKKR